MSKTEYEFKTYKMTISNFKAAMIAKAKKDGICEDFGQKELNKLKDKYGYNPYGTTKEKQICDQIDQLFNWCINYEL